MKVHSHTDNNKESVLFDSSNVLKITYSEKTMDIIYGKGLIYRYTNVPRYVFLEITNAPSQGIIVNRLLKSQGRGKELYQEAKIGVLSPSELTELKKEIQNVK